MSVAARQYVAVRQNLSYCQQICGADACCQAPTRFASCLCAVLTRIGDWVHEEQLSPEECRRSLSGLSGAYVAAAMMWLAWWDSNPRHSG